MNLFDARDKAQQDLFEAISMEVTNLPKIQSTVARARALSDLALAFRYTYGGQQPGSVSVAVEK